MNKKAYNFIKLFYCSIMLISNNIIAQETSDIIHLEKPLTMKMNGNSIGCNPYIEYYSNGQIKEVGCQGYYESQGTILGMVYQFDETGKLIISTYYHPDKFGKDYKIVREYNQQSKVISEKIYNNDALYAVDEVELNKIPD